MAALQSRTRTLRALYLCGCDKQKNDGNSQNSYKLRTRDIVEKLDQDVAGLYLQRTIELMFEV